MSLISQGTSSFSKKFSTLALSLLSSSSIEPSGFSIPRIRSAHGSAGWATALPVALVGKVYDVS